MIHEFPAAPRTCLFWNTAVSPGELMLEHAKGGGKIERNINRIQRTKETHKNWCLHQFLLSVSHKTVVLLWRHEMRISSPLSPFLFH